MNILEQLKNNKKILIAICIASALILFAIILPIILFPREKETPTPEPTPTPTATPIPTPTPEPTPEPEDIPVNFAEWQAINPDVYAWIYIPNTNVDYPILQHPTDPSYYLDYNIDGTKGYPGCIYTEYYNTKTFTDMHTVIYGHNMKDGSMFRTLHKFEDRAFFDANRVIYIYLPDQVLEYEIFAAYVFDDRHLLGCYALDQPGVFQEYINNIYLQKKGNIATDITVTAADKIITLETCTGNSSTRYLVTGVLRSVKPGAYKGNTTTGSAITAQ